MSRTALLALLALLAAPAVTGAFERIGVVAVADPPLGPDPDLAELAHQLRAACRDRIGGVEDVPTMRARILGQTSSSTLSELDRAYGGALAVYQNGEFESALRTLHAIVEDLESLPETEDSYSQWIRARLRLAHAALTIGREAEADASLLEVARTDPSVVAEPDQYPPSYRRRFEAAKAKVRALPRRKISVTSEGAPGTVFVNGRPMGETPVTFTLPAGTWRLGGAAGSLRVPTFRIDAEADDRAVVLDFALAASLRVNAGPGLALAAPRRGDGIVRAGAWLGVDRVIAVSRVFEGEAAFLAGSIWDVRRGALLREGSVRTVAGSVPAANLGALAAFLLTGQSQRDVRDRTESARERIAAATPPPAPAAAATPPAPPPVERVAPPAAPAVAATTVAPPAAPAVAAAAPSVRAPPPVAAAKVEPAPPAVPAARPTPPAAASAPSTAPGQKETPPGKPPARPSLAVTPPASDPAASLTKGAGAVRPRSWMRPTAWGAGIAAAGLGALAVQQGLSARSSYADAAELVGPGGVFLGDPERYRALRADGDAARRNAYLSAGAAAALAAAAGTLGWISRDHPPEPGIAFRF